MEFYPNIHVKMVHCKDCNDVIPDAYLQKEGRCRHCHTKSKHGAVDITTCFQGSVIILED